MVSIKTLALIIVAPAGAIVAGALLQQLLVWVWPGVQAYTVYNVTLDSYFGAVALGSLAFCAGLWVRRSAPARAIVIPALIVPTAWLLLFEFVFNRPAGLLNALGVAYTAAAVAPFLGVGLAYLMPSNNRSNGPGNA